MKVFEEDLNRIAQELKELKLRNELYDIYKKAFSAKAN